MDFMKLGRMERRLGCLLAAALMATETDDTESVAARAEEFEHFVNQAGERAALLQGRDAC